MTDQVIQNQVGFAPEIAPFAQNLLGMAQGQAFTYQKDASGNVVKDANGLPVISGFQQQPTYQQWAQQQGLTNPERVAQFTDLQKKSFTAADQLGVNPYSTTAAQGLEGLAQKAGNYAYNPQQYGNAYTSQAQYNPSTINANTVNAQSFTQPGTASQYMSPYMQNVVNVQQREAQRNANIANQSQAAQAIKAGAFGGGRDAIMRSEAARNLALQKGDIQATGQQAAFQNAQQQFNSEQQARLQAQLANQGAGLTAQQLQEQARQFGYGQQMNNAQNMAQYGQAANQLNAQQSQFGAGLGLQGLQAGMTGYQNLGNQGQTLYGQNMGNINLQNQFGTQQQQNVQNVLTNQYQDYLTNINNPYKQMGFLSDMYRGAPLSQQGSTMYTSPPSMLNQVAGLGMAGAGMYGAYNAAQGRKEGGEIKETPRSAGLAELLVHKMA